MRILIRSLSVKMIQNVALIPIVINLFRLRLYFVSLLKYGSTLDFGIRNSDFGFRISDIRHSIFSYEWIKRSDTANLKSEI